MSAACRNFNRAAFVSAEIDQVRPAIEDLRYLAFEKVYLSDKVGYRSASWMPINTRWRVDLQHPTRGDDAYP
ncbi:MAG: hypothetical protein WAN75_42985, partial [Xanthobacteraceae bacterium]